jgi:SAM-dependent methyltransferase
MLTVRLEDMALEPGMRVLDLGCGRGRHLHALYWNEIPLEVVGVDLSHGEVKAALDGFFQLPPPDPHSPLRSAVLSAGDAARLPFADNSFDRVLCSEVLEHVPDPDAVLAEIARILKPGGIFAASVPRYWPEAICWKLSTAYHNTPGGHVRIFRTKALRDQVRKQGFAAFKRHWAHGLHSPYWWLQCALWESREHSAAVRLYRKFLEWDLMQKPLLTQGLEWLLAPVMGKSLVMYFRKVG